MKELMSFSCPLFVRCSLEGKKYWLNMNQYRNWHYRLSNNIKHCFVRSMNESTAIEVYAIPKITNKPLKTIYNLYWRDAGRVDVANVCSIVQKFFEDWLVGNGIIEDDSSDIINTVEYKFCGIDRDNPRVEVLIVDKNAD